jgi:hypothetical protein
MEKYYNAVMLRRDDDVIAANAADQRPGALLRSGGRGRLSPRASVTPPVLRPPAHARAAAPPVCRYAPRLRAQARTEGERPRACVARLTPFASSAPSRRCCSGAKGGERDGVAVPQRGRHRLAVAGVPDMHTAVVADADDALAVRTERGAQDGDAVPGRRHYLAPRVRLPNRGHAVRAGRHEWSGTAR